MQFVISVQIWNWAKRWSRLPTTRSTQVKKVYEKEWVSETLDSSQFQEPTGHENNSTQKFGSGQSQAKAVTVGAFSLPETLINKITSNEPYPLPDVPAELASDTANIVEGVFHTHDANGPQIGDERVSFSLAKPGDVSVMAVQTGNTFEAFQAKNGKTRFLLCEGLLSADEVIAVEEQKAKFLRWALRIGGFILMTLGFSLVFKPLSVLADVIPFLGNLVGAASGIIAAMLAAGISLIIIAISWITFRPLIAVPILLIAGAALLFGIEKLMAKRSSSPQTA